MITDWISGPGSLMITDRLFHLNAFAHKGQADNRQSAEPWERHGQQRWCLLDIGTKGSHFQTFVLAFGFLVSFGLASHVLESWFLCFRLDMSLGLVSSACKCICRALVCFGLLLV